MKFLILVEVIETFGAWNTEPLKQNKAYDKLMVEALILTLVTPDDLANGNVSDVVCDFIHGILEIRVDGDTERFSKINEYIEEVRSAKKT